MSANAIQAGLLVMVVALLVKPVGAYLERVFERRHTFFDPLLLPAERMISQAYACHVVALMAAADDLNLFVGLVHCFYRCRTAATA